MTAAERLWDPGSAFDHPVTLWTTVVLIGLLLVAPIVTLALARIGIVGPETRADVLVRCKGWAILAPAILGPILLGSFWVIGATCVLALLCHNELSRATGLFRERLVSLVVVLAIFATALSAADHWYSFFTAIWPVSCAVVAAVAILPDRPQGYVQRTALGVLALSLLVGGLGHFAYIANDALFRPILLWLLVGVQLNDVFAYVTGRAFGRRKLCPATSPNKTLGGAIGALILTTCVSAYVGHHVFEGTGMDTPAALLGAGVLISLSGQLGDLVLSSVKRDLDIKDMGTTLPGHGGLLDRFDSLLIAAPLVFHYVGYLRPGFGLDQPMRILTAP